MEVVAGEVAALAVTEVARVVPVVLAAGRAAAVLGMVEVVEVVGKTVDG